ncbi:MAG: nitrogen fixation protein NifZ [Akkermansiaceae bacterium]|nr:nitrogen fixation protein NifZ [Akkermansiaceae bacterium]
MIYNEFFILGQDNGAAGCRQKATWSCKVYDIPSSEREIKLMANLEVLEEGDVVYAATAIYNDGGLEDVAENALLAPAGARGVIVRKGHLEQDEARRVFLVRFEDVEKNLSEPIGCWAEELRAEEAR